MLLACFLLCLCLLSAYFVFYSLGKVLPVQLPGFPGRLPIPAGCPASGAAHLALRLPCGYHPTTANLPLLTCF